MSSKPEMRVVIPSRFASSRLPGKPLVDIGGLPMVARVHRAVEDALPQAEVVVATDDERVLRVARSHGADAVMTDPGLASGTDRAAEVARVRGWKLDDLVINVQGDEPLIPKDLLVRFSAFLGETDGLTIGTVSCPVSSHDELRNPNVVKVVTRRDRRALYFSRAEIPFARDTKVGVGDILEARRHIGVYGYTVRALAEVSASAPCALEGIERLEQLRALWLGHEIHVMDWPELPPHGVDTEEDLAKVRAWVASRGLGL